MMTTDPIVFKWLASKKKQPVRIDDSFFWTIPDEEFTPEEIEDLREYDASCFAVEGCHSIANFLPDDVRPAWVKKL